MRSLLSHYDLLSLIDLGVITGSGPEFVNAASIDITLGDEILWEMMPDARGRTVEVSLRERTRLNMGTFKIPDEGVLLHPGHFILAHSVQKFYLPPDLSAEYKLKSSMARIGLEHLNAGWCDAGWNDSCLTLELVNVSRFHSIRLHAGDRIGQMVFFMHEPVPEHASYATKGRYNGDHSVAGIKP